MTIAKIFTVTRNETDLIESFLLYHGKIFGYDNIIVIDNMSTCPIVKSVYHDYIKRGITVVYESINNALRHGDAYTKHMRKYIKKAQFLIGLDSDEFLYIRGQANTVNDIESYLRSIPLEISVIKVSTYLSSVPDVKSSFYINQKINNPAVNITTFNTEKISPQKCIYRACNFISAINSCNGCKVNGGNVYVSKRFVYFHFHNTGGRRSMEKAIDLINCYKYTDTSKPVLKQFESLLNKKVYVENKRVLEYCLLLSKILCLNYIIKKDKWPTIPELCNLSKKIDVISKIDDIDVSKMKSLPLDWESRYEQILLKDNLNMEETNIKTCINTSLLECVYPIYKFQTKSLKKVALLLSGHLRNFSMRRDFWKEFNKKFGDRVDIYIHTWNETGIRSKTQWIDIGKDTPNFDEVRKALKPRKMMIEDHSEKIKSFSFKTRGLKLYYTDSAYLKKTDDFTRNVGSQLYSIMKAWELAKESNIEYDMMIRMRNDCIIRNFENIFNRDTSFLEKDVLIVNGNSHKHPHGGGGCNKCNIEYPLRRHNEHSNDVCDIMYLGSTNVMGRVCNMFNDVQKLVLSFKKYNELAIKDKEVKKSLIEYPGIYGVKNPKIYETKLKCFYPERLIREYMNKTWILSDMMGLLVQEKYK